jgi:aminoglycoside phosphotransferase (APT) family kinase protein
MNAPVLLHGDYWHGNVIRNDGLIAAVIDWEDVAVGDPLADVAMCRIETHWSFGVDAGLQFTDRYTANMPDLDLVNLPFWELYAALGPTAKLSTWGLDPDTEAGMRAVLHEHVERALAALSKRSGKL